MSRLSSDRVCAQHPQVQANSLAVDSRSSLAALAGRRSITLVHLDQPTQTLKTIARSSKWDASASEFHPRRSVFYALSSSQNVEIYQLDQAVGRGSGLINYRNFHAYASAGAAIGQLTEPDGPVGGRAEARGATMVLKGHTRWVQWQVGRSPCDPRICLLCEWLIFSSGSPWADASPT